MLTVSAVISHFTMLMPVILSHEWSCFLHSLHNRFSVFFWILFLLRKLKRCNIFGLYVCRYLQALLSLNLLLQLHPHPPNQLPAELLLTIPV